MPEDIEQSEETRRKGVSLNALYPNLDIRIMRDLAPEFGVTIQILVKEGNTYSHEFRDKKNQIHVVHKAVPEGKSYINLSSPKIDLRGFWEAVKAEEAKQPTANPRKI